MIIITIMVIMIIISAFPLSHPLHLEIEGERESTSE